MADNIETEPPLIGGLLRGTMEPDQWATLVSRAVVLGAETVPATALVAAESSDPTPQGPVLNKPDFFAYAEANQHLPAFATTAYRRLLFFAEAQAQGSEYPIVVLGIPFSQVPLAHHDFVRRDIEAHSLKALTTKIFELAAEAGSRTAGTQVYEDLGRHIGRGVVRFWDGLATQHLEAANLS